MARAELNPTGQERFFGEDELIVSKTDLQGRIAYANRVFRRISDYDEADLRDQPHSLIRHPEMPRAVFRLLWQRLQAGQEVFAYVVNLTKFGDHYWVLAHVTPTFDATGRMTGYHSSRRVPDRAAVASAREVYRVLLDEERRHTDRTRAAQAGMATLEALLAERGCSYDQWVFSLMQ